MPQHPRSPKVLRASQALSAQSGLFEAEARAQPVPSAPELRADLDQHFSPHWAAEMLVAHYFPDLGARDLVADPTCGHGAFLHAIPAGVEAIGVEIDASVAEIARRETGRRVITGDFRTVELPGRPTALIGNPPFDAEIIDGILDRAHTLLPEGGRVGLILPCYIFQTPSRVLGYSERWSLRQDMIPRTLFPGLSKPLCFAVYTKDRRRVLHGFLLYGEAMAIAAMPEAYRRILERAPRSVWVRCVAEALRNLGGRARLDRIYAEIGGKRPTTTAFWREKVRQVLQSHFTRVDEGTYALAA